MNYRYVQTYYDPLLLSVIVHHSVVGSLKSSMSKGEGGVYLYRLMETRRVLRTMMSMLKCSVETEEMAAELDAMIANTREVETWNASNPEDQRAPENMLHEALLLPRM